MATREERDFEAAPAGHQLGRASAQHVACFRVRAGGENPLRVVAQLGAPIKELAVEQRRSDAHAGKSTTRVATGVPCRFSPWSCRRPPNT